jgi:integrase
MSTPLEQIKPLHLSQEWTRLLESGGRSRRTKEPRLLSAKTVRNIAGMVSSAFARGIKWGLVEVNPVTNSEPPKAQKHMAIALTPMQQELLMEAASGPWCMRAYLEIAAATGCRRGELLALRWSDIQDGRLMVERSLSQTKGRLEFKTTKTGKPRPVALPTSAIAALEAHRAQQDELRQQFGADYRNDLDLVFAGPDGEALKPDSISGSVSALFKRLKINKPKGAALHLLRHTHTSVLLASGVPVPAVSARLGHSSVRTTQEIYAHMITGQDDEAAKAWEEYQRKAAESHLKSESRKV